MSTPAHVRIYDTTLRDGTQGEGIALSVADKLHITERLDGFGMDYIEGGWPGSNPRDAAYFAEARGLRLRHARLAAFGSTRRAGRDCASDPQVGALLDAQTPVVTLVGKTWLLHVTEILRTTAEENLAMIEDTVRHCVAAGREVVYDAEHFFDGYAENPDYALRTLEAAARGGAAWLTLCDTNGGRLVPDVQAAVAEAVRRFGGERIAVHCHNDAGVGVAVSLAGIAAGARMVQGTMNGYGERTGNANLTTILPNLVLKMGCIAACGPNLAALRDLSLFVDEIANRRPDHVAPFVGRSSFAHKGGLHADATRKVAHSYQHIDPAAVGNAPRVLVSDMAGKASLLMKARELGHDLDPGQPEVRRLLEEIKELEFRGYEFEAADGSLALVIARTLGQHRPAFTDESYRVIVEKRGAEMVAEATVRLRIGGELRHTVAESTGPVGALDRALRLALERDFPEIGAVALKDFKVRILDSRQGANERIRVLAESTDGATTWGTVGVSDNIIEASWQALQDSVEYKILLEERRRAGSPA